MTVVVYGDKNLVGVSPQTTKTDALVYKCGGKSLWLSTNAALYLGNGTRCSYYGGLTESHRRSLKWWHCRWPRVTPDPQMAYFVIFEPPFASLSWVKLDTSNLVHLLIVACSSQLNWLLNGAWPWLRDPSLQILSKVALCPKRYKIATWLQCATNKKSHAAYRITLPMTLSDP